MTNLKKCVLFLNLIFFSFFVLALSSCDSEIAVKSLKDGTFSVRFDSAVGKIFSDTLSAFSGSEDGFVFNAEEIKKSMENLGFESVLVSVSSSENISISAKIPSSENIFTKSGILESKKIVLSKNSLFEFYKNCPELFKSYLDLFMAPVFMEENSTSEEWLSLIGEVYGEPLKNEIASSKVKISFENEKGSVSKKTVSLAELFTLQQKIEF